MAVLGSVNLAIVIPAYKREFLEETLDSLCNQTNPNFNVYVGDDCSPSDLYSIVQRYKGRLNIHYERFSVNLGGEDLVAHWNRCIDLTRDEEWIWMFSDDDTLDSNCVGAFYKEIERSAVSHLYHFDVVRIDSHGNELLSENEYPKTLSGSDFFGRLQKGEINSYVVEYIFNREHFFKLGGFVNFDLAWGSDHATWIKLAMEKEMVTIPNAKVRWRSSGVNISSINQNKDLLRRKRDADISYQQWAADFFLANGISYPCSDLCSLIWFLQGLKTYIKFYGFSPVPGWINEFSIIKRAPYYKLFCYSYLSAFVAYLFIRRSGSFILRKT